MKVLKAFNIDVSVLADYDQARAARRAINKHYLGDEECNCKIGGALLAKYPEKETPEYHEAFSNAMRGADLQIVVELMEDGTFRVKK